MDMHIINWNLQKSQQDGVRRELRKFLDKARNFAMLLQEADHNFIKKEWGQHQVISNEVNGPVVVLPGK